MLKNKEEIFRELKEILRSTKYVNDEIIDGVTEEQNLVNDLGLSSIMMMCIIVMIEEHFNIKIDIDISKNFTAIKDIIEIINEKINKSI